MKFILSLIFLLGIVIPEIYAQKTITASGGEASDNKGTVSYSVGQVAYSTNSGTNGTVTQGVQQAYEIYTTTGINEIRISLSVTVYPNPTSNYLNLKIENFEFSTFNFQLFDMQGKLLQTQKITGNETQIDMSNYVPSTYIVRIIKQNQLIKEFKIIKK